MRIAIVYDATHPQQQTMARALQGILQNNNHTADLKNISDVAKLTGYQYLIIFAATVSFFRGKISQQISYFLSQAGNLVGKKGAAVLIKRPSFGQLRGLQRLMQGMEQEGIVVHYSNIVSKAAELSRFCASLSR